jgi:hypothetical protein
VSGMGFRGSPVRIRPSRLEPDQQRFTKGARRLFAERPIDGRRFVWGTARRRRAPRPPDLSRCPGPAFSRLRSRDRRLGTCGWSLLIGWIAPDRPGRGTNLSGVNGSCWGHGVCGCFVGGGR